MTETLEGFGAGTKLAQETVIDDGQVSTGAGKEQGSTEIVVPIAATQFGSAVNLAPTFVVPPSALNCTFEKG